jgi:ATP-dependent Lhr-like helicase
MSGGTIPDTADYKVVLEPQAIIVGTVNEDFAVESMAGDIFQLGNTSYRIQRVERDRLRVEDAHGAPPSIPFWLGEAPGRSKELSFGVSRLRDEVAETQLDAGGVTSSARGWRQTATRLGRGRRAATGRLPGPREGRARRAADAAHAGAGALLRRIRWHPAGDPYAVGQPHQSRVGAGAAQALLPPVQLRAAGCGDRGRDRAVAVDQPQLPLDEVARYLHSNTAEHVLIQALLDAPLFGARWRWNAVTALALPRFVSAARRCRRRCSG